MGMHLRATDVVLVRLSAKPHLFCLRQGFMKGRPRAHFQKDLVSQMELLEVLEAS